MPPALRPFCSSAPGLYAASDRLAEADVVILAASWDHWVVKQLPETLAEIRQVSKARILPGLVCGGTDCPVFTDDGRLISYDGFHYTPDGAKEVGRLMFADARLSGLR